MVMLKMYLRYGEISMLVDGSNVLKTLTDYRNNGIDIVSYYIEQSPY